MTLTIPTEDVEQSNFVQWLQIKGYKFTSIPNSTYTKSWSQKAKNQRNGLRAGFPDMVVIVNKQLICIEIKRIKGGVTSPAQQGWITALKEAGVPTKVCAGAQEAITFVNSIVR